MTDRSSNAGPEKPQERETARAEKPAPAESGRAKSDRVKSGEAKLRQPAQAVEEIGGRDGPDPTRYGDYEKDGRCVDF